MFEREDWTLFRSLGTLGQKAGVPLRDLAALVVKEVADNALDAGANVEIRRYRDDWIVVEDDGPGLPEGKETIARLFSIRRPLTSSKLVRLPSRGALGNGLRVAVGAILASRGEMYVETKGVRYHIYPRDDGYTDVSTEASDVTKGTRVSMRFGSSIPLPSEVLGWANLAASFGALGKNYSGKTSPWWYDTEAWFEMCHAAVNRPLEDLLMVFRDIKQAKARELAQDRIANTLSREEAEHLLIALRMVSPEPKASVLGKMGEVLGEDFAYAHENGSIEVRGIGTEARLPYSIDVYVKTLDESDDDQITFLVNRTPITGKVSLQRQKSHQLGIIGCGLSHLVDVGRKPVQIVCNITTPYMPVTTDGKEPDLFRYVHPLYRVIAKAAKKSKRNATQINGRRVSQRDVIVDNLTDAINKASGNGTYRYSLRQLFYAVRPYMLDVHGKEPDYNYFAQVITDIEAEQGEDLPGMYRDARGVLYHPHTQEEIPLGTLSIEKYKRPEWGFNKVLYSEKEGLLTILKDIGWPEKNDCALMTSKGFASRAARDVIDLIGQSEEEIYFFCIHDSDASGTLIYQSLTEGTRARGARKVHVINLGLDPWEALDMGLQVETFRSEEGKGGKRGQRRLPVAEYIDEDWSDWLQTQRVELNAMSSPQFISWLDTKFAKYADKVVPPKTVLRDHFESSTEKSVRNLLAHKILKEAGFDAQVAELMATAKKTTEDLDLETVVRQGLSDSPKSRWDNPLTHSAEGVASRLVRED